MVEHSTHIRKVVGPIPTSSTNMKNKIIFYIIWLGVLSLVPISLLANTPPVYVLRNSSTIANFVQRFLGLTAFTLLFFQIILGAFMEKWTNKLGGWIFRFHIIEGVIAYILIILHPISFMFFNYFLGRGLDPFYIFTGFCLLCPTRIDFFYTLGRVSFWLLNISVWAGLLRAATPYMRVNWRKFHILNYLVFVLIGIHSIGVGTDVGTPPFSFFHGPALITVGIIIIYKLFVFAKARFANKS
ncbi:MAG: hypothetical protein UU16_C0014G0001 [Candidatus Woesebacteria bacterium GW2011_GWA2_40_7]|uniref:Ferric oxidoreductase domain-containing protein n=3 Tax=Candidatus Woeseibacteriota TaxID=1752722 RepID=A0A0G0P0W2_9BACT|nr:MAG: hypothetical protein UT17_C0004G0072 [Candidatus Woesebacteria bacterium GW2011_GWB1_39_10]KKR73742.1 MAG: hypothetical protein UU16_C0014G0001 [Candidatus Woesebacteria bacterium GW2011_GWA2_40_7]